MPAQPKPVCPVRAPRSLATSMGERGAGLLCGLDQPQGSQQEGPLGSTLPRFGTLNHMANALCLLALNLRKADTQLASSSELLLLSPQAHLEKGAAGPFPGIKKCNTVFILPGAEIQDAFNVFFCTMKYTFFTLSVYNMPVNRSSKHKTG